MQIHQTVGLLSSVSFALNLREYFNDMLFLTRKSISFACFIACFNYNNLNPLYYFHLSLLKHINQNKITSPRKT